MTAPDLETLIARASEPRCRATTAMRGSNWLMNCMLPPNHEGLHHADLGIYWSPPAPATCVCGHVDEHHGAQGDLLYSPECTWHGCGCPRFIDAAGRVGVSPPQAPDLV